MYSTASGNDIKRIDPIWKRLRVERIWRFAFLIFYIVYAVYMITLISRTQSFTFFFPMFIAIIAIYGVFDEVRQERYWKRIGQHRLEALQRPEAFQAVNQPFPDAQPLSLPFTLRLRWQRGVLLTIAGLLLILFGVIFVTMFMGLISHINITALFFLAGFLAFTILALVLLLYFQSMRYQPQSIEITEEGIKTRYMRQERSILWNQARLFGGYEAQGIRKSPMARTYELSDGQTVVRWSTQVMAIPFLHTETSNGTKEDWNRLIGRVNALVAAKTGLPLVDLGDRLTQQPVAARTVQSHPSQGEQASISIPQPATTPLAQDDPIVRRIQLRGEVGIAYAFMLVVFGLIFLFGLLSKTGIIRLSRFEAGFADTALWLGALMLVLMLLGMGTLVLVSRYWRRIQSLRQQAIQQPEHFRAAVQPAPFEGTLQPASIHIRMKKSFSFLIMFLSGFIIWSIASLLILHPIQNNGLSWVLADLSGALILSLIMSAILLPLNRRSSERWIEVSENGITTHIGNTEASMRWEDARFFSTYRPWQLIKRTPKSQQFELASQQTVVRWQWFHSRLFKMEPEMSQEEFDRWMEQLNGYVTARTGLPLEDLSKEER